MPLRLPQARDFDKLRHLLRLIAEGHIEPKEIGTLMGARPKYAARHADYYREAAEVLGLLEVPRKVLTARGRGLLATVRGSEEERQLLRNAVRDAECLGDLRSALLDPADPDIPALVEYAAGYMQQARHTIERRVKDTLSWRTALGTASPPRPKRHVVEAESLEPGGQLSLLARAPTIAPADWPDPARVPFNWPRDGISVETGLYEDLHRSEEVLIVTGYASLQHLCNFVGSLEPDVPEQVRVVFGNEPSQGRAIPTLSESETLSDELRDFWLERGISIVYASDVLRTLEALDQGRLRTRISRRMHPVHAKIYVGQDGVTLGSSNFTYPGLRAQLEANLRLGRDRSVRPYVEDTKRLAEVYWTLSVDFDHELRQLLHELLQNVTWAEALARACAELLEGQWARAHLQDELGIHEQLWPSQIQGIGQALYVLMEVGSVLVADATGSGKTKTGAWLLRALRERLVATGRPISDPVLVSPPAVTPTWLDELHDAEIRVEAHSHGVLSTGRAAAHRRVVEDVETARILALDEAHNFINPSNRSAIVTTNLADHVVLFTATPINRDVSDLLGIADLLGADNLDDETLGVLEETGWRRRRELTPEDRVLLKQTVRRFTVRRTKAHFNALIDREPHRYTNRKGKPCRYPQHVPRYYRMTEARSDRKIGGEITRLARTLRGVIMFRKPLILSQRMREQGWTPETYVNMRLRCAQALARYQVRLALRSSRAALWEHLHGTDAAKERFGLRRLEKSDSGDVLVRLDETAREGPVRIDEGLRPFAPEWLTDDDAHAEACEQERTTYREIAELCAQLSDGRERAKAEHLRRLLESHRLVVAFDSRPITLAVIRKLVDADDVNVLLATGGDRGGQRRVRDAFELGSEQTRTLALCSNSMSEGINLQQASAVVHLDMPSVVRIAEQRVGRIDRMDSPHDRVESWWPKDAPEFALSSDEKLDERLDLVEAILGSNVTLPSQAPEVVNPEDFVAQMEEDERRQLELLDDAFSAVRDFVEGPNALVSPELYASIRKSSAKVLAAVAVVRSDTVWGFFALESTPRSAPRWLFVDPAAADGRVVITALDEVAARLRERLREPSDIELDEAAVGVMHMLLDHVQQHAASLLPRRKQRALEQMHTVLQAYRKAAKQEEDALRANLAERLHALAQGHDRADLEELVESWLAAIRPRWREALRHPGRGGRRSRLRRLSGLTPRLIADPLPTQTLRAIADRARVAPPLGERIVAAIVGVARP